MTDLRRTARTTGLWYLALAVTGVLGFLVVRPALFVADDPTATAANLVGKAGLAHLGVVLELGIVLTQALVAIWFFRLFRGFDAVAAGTLAAFGLVNAVMILASGAFLATALAVAADPTLAPGGDVAATVQLLHVTSARFWAAGAVFFGLWLLPMGWLARTSGLMPRALGWTLMVGGAGYVLSALVDHGIAAAPGWLVEGLTAPASIGEFWMIGYLLIRGVRPVTSATHD